MTDILERNQTTFVKDRVQQGLNWEDSLAKGESYSSYMLKGTTFRNNLHLLQTAYKMACTAISTVTREKVFIGLHPKDNFATSCKKIFLSTEVIEDKSLTDFEKIDVFCGAAIHEAMHIEETDFEKLSFPLTPEGKIKHSICNVIEDERGEVITAGKHPGYGRFFEKTKYYYFDTYYLRNMPNHAKLTAGQKLFNLFFSIVRYPKYINRADTITFKNEVEQINQALSPYPATSDDVVIAVEKIYQILKNHHVEQNPSPSAKGGQGNSADTDTEKSLSEDLGVMAGMMSKVHASSLEQGNNKQINVSKTVEANPIEISLLQGRLEKGKSENVYFTKAEENRLAYQLAKAEIAPYAAALSAILAQGYRNYEITHRSLRNGQLDTTKLVDGYLGSENIYKQKEHVQTQPLDIALLVDQSGSMGGKKIEQARKCAVLFKESLLKLRGIITFIYGHTADETCDGSTDLSIFLEPKYSPLCALGSLTAKGYNRDGVAIEETARRIRKFSANPCILFVLSDGQPNAQDYEGEDAINHTRESVKRAEKLGFTIIQIAIEPNIPSERMFSKYVRLTTLASLPKELGLVLKKAIEQMRK